MTLQEFKAWFDGFTEGMDSQPNAKQWKRIKERVKEIDGTPVSYPVYVDRWYPYPYARPYIGTAYGTSFQNSCGTVSGASSATMVGHNATITFDDMYFAGQADALTLNHA